MTIKTDYSNPVYMKACKTARQRTVLSVFLESEQDHVRAALALGIHPSNVYKILKRIEERTTEDHTSGKGANILVFDIETAPMLGAVWGMWKNNVGLNQIKEDWYVISWAAKWLGAPESSTMYQDLRNAKDRSDDYEILEGIHDLLDKADIVVTQNGKAFDQRKLNARFIMQGFKPVSSFRHYDTLIMAKKHFKFTSNRLEYMTHNMCTKYKKQRHAKFGGFDLWKATCWDNNPEAWNEMEEYNKYDVLSLEEVFYKLAPYDNSLNLSVYHDDHNHHCVCGSTSHSHNGYYYTNAGKYHRYSCDHCGAETRGRDNLLSKEKRKSMHMPTVK